MNGENKMKMQRGSIFRPEQDYYKIAGIIMMIGCFQFILAVNLAETHVSRVQYSKKHNQRIRKFNTLDRTFSYHI